MASDSQDAIGGQGAGLTERGVGPGMAISRIESLLESVIDSLISAEPMTIEIMSRRRLRSRRSQTSSRQVQFPGRFVNEARSFARIVLILQLAHDALVSGTVLTKRNIFYQHQSLFESQRTVDELVDDIAITLDLDRADLNIVASAKGVVAGLLNIHLQDGRDLDASSREGIMIPASGFIESMDVGQIRWVLVIEKDATFRSLSSSQYWQRSASGEGLLVTAKGYPDMITRSFLHSLSGRRPNVPIFVLTDFDPDGLNIFHCYLSGSGNVLSDSTPILHSAFNGVGRPNEVEILDPASDTADSISSIACHNTALSLTARDRKAIVHTLERFVFFGNSDSTILSLRRELQIMAMLGYKAEIQLLDESGNLDAWLDTYMQIGMDCF